MLDFCGGRTKNQQHIQSIYGVGCWIRPWATLVGGGGSHYLPTTSRSAKLTYFTECNSIRTLYVVSYPSRRVSRLCDDWSSSGLTRF